MRRAGTTVVMCVTLVTGAWAQNPRGADTLSPRAIADSQKILRGLQERVRSNSQDAAAWHQIGTIAWALGARARAANPPADLDATRLLVLADTALRVAAAAAPGKSYYRLDVGRFLLAQDNPITRAAAGGQFSKALDAARAAHDSAGIGAAAVEYGRTFWRTYDRFQNRRISTSGIDVGRSISDAMQPVARAAGAMQAAAAAASLDPGGSDASFDALPQTSMKDVRQTIENATMALPSDVNGAAEYAHAEQLFAEAYRVAPSNPRTFRSMAMLLADSARWRELDSYAREHTRALPWDPAGWLALGLALHREGQSRAAAGAFDSAMTCLSPTERARFDRLDRVLRPADTARIARSPATDHLALARMYWLFADPLWSREGNESRVEFLARVEFADLRWTVEELGLRGADTDRGDIFIRYGPPDVVASIGPGVTGDMTDVVTFWLYKSGLMFAFSGMPGYGSARTPNGDVKMVGAFKDAQPVRWDNLADFTVDTLPTQVARFRVGRDSIDVIVATRPNVAAIVKASEVREAAHSWFWLLSGGTVPVVQDSTVLDSSGDVRSWTRRLPAGGGYVYRIEAGSASSKRAGRATGQVVAAADPRTGFAMSGFGVSDLLLATTTVQPSAATGRWRDFQPVPIVGAVPRNSQLNLVWENYEFGQTGGSASYTVAVTIVRDRSGAGRIAAQIVGALADIAQIDHQSDRVVIRFDRTGPSAAAFADQVDIGLGDTPAGSYTLTLEVTDKATGRKTTRSTSFVIHD